MQDAATPLRCAFARGFYCQSFIPIYNRRKHLAVEVISYSSCENNIRTFSASNLKKTPRKKLIEKLTLQLLRTLPQCCTQIFQIIPRRDPKLPHKIPCRAFQIAVVAVLVSLRDIVLGSAKICVAGDGRCAFEALQSALGLSSSRGVEIIAAKELVGRDALLRAELLAGIFFVVICMTRSNI